MKLRSPFTLLLGCLLAITAAGCGDATSNTPPNTDAAADVTPDVPAVDQPDSPDPVDAEGLDAVTQDVPAPEDTRPVDAPTPPPDAPPDAAAPDAPRDVGADAPRDMPGDIRADAPADVRVDTGPPISCTECRTTLCMTSNTACQSSVFCVERFRCLDRCPGMSNPAECRSGCTRAWPAMAASNAFMTCLRTNCPGSCPNYP